MHYIDPLYALILIVTGFIAGIINTFAGGGSNLTIPALMIMGMPADIANATNRIGVFLQSVVGVRGFQKHGKLDNSNAVSILIPTILGALAGALLASYLPVSLLKPMLLGTMVTMSLIILIKPSAVIPDEAEKTLRISERPSSLILLFASGFYGGFVQAGVGFILLAAIAGSLRYDLVRANALKMLCTLVFTFFALAIFVARNQVLWLPGLILALGTMTGAYFGVKISLKISQKVLKWFLFIMTLAASASALWF